MLLIYLAYSSLLNPNPTNSTLNIEGLKNDSYRVTICNISGAMEIKQTIDSNRFMSVDVSSLRSGQYYIQITGEQTHLSRRFIKN